MNLSVSTSSNPPFSALSDVDSRIAAISGPLSDDQPILYSVLLRYLNPRGRQ